MSKKKNEIKLNELRDKSAKTSANTTFGKKVFGGYNAKQVSEYIDRLNENLHNAEESFNTRLEEFASMTAMLKQERDQYGEMYNACKNSKIDIIQQLETLKSENDQLNNLIKELSQNKDANTSNPVNEDLLAENLAMKKELAEHQDYEQECIRLKDQLDQLKLMVQELNAELKHMATNEVTVESPATPPDDNLDQVLAENEVLKKQYEDALSERSNALAENSMMKEENKRLSELIEKNAAAHSQKPQEKTSMEEKVNDLFL